MIAHVIEAMVDVVLMVDVEGQIVLVNSAAERVTEYRRDELLGLPIAKVLEDERSGLRTQVRRRIEDGDVLRREDSWLVPKHGEPLPVSVTGAPVLDETGAVQGIVLVVRDTRELRQLLREREAEIAARRSAETELRAAMASIEDRLEHTRAQLLLAERRATLGTLAGGVGHELRNIAQVHVAAVDLLSSAVGDDQRELASVVKTVLADLERIGDHIQLHGRRLTQLARPGPDHVHPLELGGVVRDVVAMLQGAGKLHRIDVELELADRPFLVTVNRTRIEQILVNLVVNAADAIARPGTIWIRMQLDPSGARVVVEVADTGGGIPPELLDRVFEPFFTTKTADRGTGLGLPVAREIVESYGGQLVVRSTLGSGTTFAFDLPLSIGSGGVNRG